MPRISRAGQTTPQERQGDVIKLIQAHAAPRCQHIKVNGTQCQSPAMKRHNFCYFHERANNRLRFEAVEIGTLEDANSVQCSIEQVVRAVIMGFMDQKTAGLALYGLQTAAMNLPNCDFEPEAADVVLDEEGSTLDDLECDDPHCPDYGQEPRPKLVYREGTKPRGMGFAQKVIARMEEMMSEMKVEKQASAEVSLPVLNPRTD